MKSILLAAIVFVMSCFAFGSSSAQSTSAVKVTIPFAFTVGEVTAPAGTYYITGSPNSLFVRMESPDGSIHLSAIARHEARETSDHNARIVFHRYGEHYFLTRISQPGMFANLQFATTRAEKRARTQVEIAGVSNDDPVIVALN